MTTVRAIVLTMIAWVGFVALLGFVPWGMASPDAPRNVADVLGYDIDLAFVLVVAWSCAVIGLTVLISFRSKSL